MAHTTTALAALATTLIGCGSSDRLAASRVKAVALRDQGTTICATRTIANWTGYRLVVATEFVGARAAWWRAEECVPSDDGSGARPCTISEGAEPRHPMAMTYLDAHDLCRRDVVEHRAGPVTDVKLRYDDAGHLRSCAATRADCADDCSLGPTTEFVIGPCDRTRPAPS